MIAICYNNEYISFFFDSSERVYKPCVSQIGKNCNSMLLLSKYCLIKVSNLFSINFAIGVILNTCNKFNILERNDILKI